MSFVDKLKRAEQCEDALRKIIEAMRQQAPKRAGRSVNGLGGWHAWP